MSEIVWKLNKDWYGFSGLADFFSFSFIVLPVHTLIKMVVCTSRTKWSKMSEQNNYFLLDIFHKAVLLWSVHTLQSCKSCGKVWEGSVHKGSVKWLWIFSIWCQVLAIEINFFSNSVSQCWIGRAAKYKSFVEFGAEKVAYIWVMESRDPSVGVFVCVIRSKRQIESEHPHKQQHHSSCYSSIMHTHTDIHKRMPYSPLTMLKLTLEWFIISRQDLTITLTFFLFSSLNPLPWSVAFYIFLNNLLLNDYCPRQSGSKDLCLLVTM